MSIHFDVKKQMARNTDLVYEHLHPTCFALTQAKRAIRTEMDALPPFHRLRDEKRAEIDQIDDMLERRRR